VALIERLHFLILIVILILILASSSYQLRINAVCSHRLLGGVQRQGQAPKPVRVPVACPLPVNRMFPEAVASLRRLRKSARIHWSAGIRTVFFQRRPRRVGHLLLHRAGKGDAFHLEFAELLEGALGELAADARLVKATAAQGRKGQKGPKDLLLASKGWRSRQRTARVKRTSPSFSRTQITVRSWVRPMSTPR